MSSCPPSRPFFLAAFLLVSLTALTSVAGCGGSGDDDDNRTTRNQTVPPFIAGNDVQYIDAIVPHHEHALEMAQMELDKGSRSEVKALAQTMKDAQMREIALLKNSRQALTGQADIPEPPTDAHMVADMAEMRAMAAGPEVDTMFLEDMIPHHAEGISIAHRALPSLQRDEVRQNANEVIAAQAREVGEMQALRQ